jgi:hypothetical protein
MDRIKDFKGEVKYDGKIVINSQIPVHERIYNRDMLLKMIQKPIHLADSLKLPLYCGEFESTKIPSLLLDYLDILIRYLYLMSMELLIPTGIINQENSE